MVPNPHLMLSSTTSAYLGSPRGACKSLKNLMEVCHGRGRGFEPRRPRHTFQKSYGTYGMTNLRTANPQLLNHRGRKSHLVEKGSLRLLHLLEIRLRLCCRVESAGA
jgi:hypothetical protein